MLIRPAAGGRAQSAGWRAFRTGRWARGGRCRWSSTSTAAAILARRGDKTTWGLLGGHGFGPQWIGLGYQQVDGDSPFGYVTRGAILLGNAVQLSDFHALNTISTSRPLVPVPRPVTVRGLCAGSGIDGSHVDPRGSYACLGYREGSRHWKRDLMLR
ncbi:OprD family outer membrane porin [Pseudomonas delhiensis]|uniref:OprD family outer membrane porin n=1 Tax=Pseudomonas delhiensis TaxID=366289 RepID=UPI003159E191